MMHLLLCAALAVGQAPADPQERALVEPATPYPSGRSLFASLAAAPAAGSMPAFDLGTRKNQVMAGFDFTVRF